MPPRADLLHRDVTNGIIGAFFEVYNILGFGFLEAVYAAALESELVCRGHAVWRERWVNIIYKGAIVARQRVDMIVDERVVVEIKAHEFMPRFARRQLVSYLTASTLEVGMLLHFGPEPKFYRLVSSASGRRHRSGAREDGGAQDGARVLTTTDEEQHGGTA